MVKRERGQRRGRWREGGRKGADTHTGKMQCSENWPKVYFSRMKNLRNQGKGKREVCWRGKILTLLSTGFKILYQKSGDFVSGAE